MKMFHSTGAGITLFLAVASLCNSALAQSCVTPVDANALKTAALQQELVVAALQCHEETAYNQFVISYRGELQSSDAALRSFFVRRAGEHGEAAYDAFKTKAANLSALDQVHNAASFCADTHALFEAALAHVSSLAALVESRSPARDLSSICMESLPKIAVAAAKVAPPGGEAKAQPLKVAEVQTPKADEVLAGVPAYALPADPYRSAMPVPPPSANSSASPSAPKTVSASSGNDVDADEKLPPPPPRYSRTEETPTPPGYRYGNYGYAPAQNWPNYTRPAPQPWNWYPPNAYYSPW